MRKLIENPIRNEVVLPKRVVPQPQPPLNAEGDCGSCALAGLLGITVEEVYERKGEVKPFCWLTLLKLVGEAYWNGELDRLVEAVPYWPNPDSLRGFGDPSWLSNLEWFAYVRMGLDAGYYGLMNYNMDGIGPFGMADHFVLVVGARDHEVPNPHSEGSTLILHELLISDSSTRTPDEQWMDHLRLLRNHGGYNVMLARPR
jgi:hypothetical protein